MNYPAKTWPLDPNNDNHYKLNYELPLFTWLPSIAPSNLIWVKDSPKLSRWGGNLLISSLRAKSLFRAILSPEGKLLGMETIKIGFRIRDLFQIGDSIYLLEDKMSQSDDLAIWKLSIISFKPKT